MQTQDTWLNGLEASAKLAVRPSRLAQLMRAGLMPYKTGVDYVLVHARAIRIFEAQFPDLLEYLRAEYEVDKLLDEGELTFSCLNFPPPNVIKLLKSVERREGSFPTRELPPSKLSFRPKLDA